MAVTTICPNGHYLTVADRLAGQTMLCPRCQAPCHLGEPCSSDPFDHESLSGQDPEDQQAEIDETTDIKNKILGISDDEIVDLLGPLDETAVKAEPKQERLKPFIRERDRFCPRCESKIPPGTHICKNCNMYLKKAGR
jgi:hypothetical protein